MHATALIMSLKYHSLSVPLAFSRAPICFTGASLFAFPHREPSLWFVSIMSDLQQGSHHAFTASLLAAREANTGQRKQGVISAMWLSEEIYTSKATGRSKAFLFTLTPRKCVVARCC